MKTRRKTSPIKKLSLLGKYMHSSWMVEVSGIPYHENEDCQQLSVKLIESISISNLHINQIDVMHWKSKKLTLNIIIYSTKRLTE